MLLKDAVEAFVNYLTIELQRSPCTVDGYKKDLKYLLNYLQSLEGRQMSLNEINTFLLRRYLVYAKEEKNYSARTMMRNIATLKSFFNFAQLEGLIDNNPAERLHAPKIPEEMPRYLHPDEIQKICNSVDCGTRIGLRDYTILMTLYYAGLRVSELVQLRVADVAGLQDISVRNGKGGKCRLIPMHVKLQQAIKNYLARRLSTSNYLFPSNRSDGPITPQSVRKIVKKYARKAGIDPCRVTPHVFRHSFATFLYKNGHVDLLRISKLLGHANLRATTIYTHTTADHLRDAIEKL